MKNLKCIARTALAGFALLSAVCGTALAGGGPSSGGRHASRR